MIDQRLLLAVIVPSLIASAAMADEPRLLELKETARSVSLKTKKRGIQPEESQTYDQCLKLVSEIPPDEMSRAANRYLRKRWEASEFRGIPFRDFPIFVDLYKHPEEYQGHPIRVKGHLQRTTLLNVETVDGPMQVCEAWLYTADSQGNPVVILTTDFPEDLPIGEQLIDGVMAEGIFYRLYTYQARDAPRYAPMLMARRLVIQDINAEPTFDESIYWMIAGAVVIVIFGALLGSSWAFRTKRRQVMKLDQPENLFDHE